MCGLVGFIGNYHSGFTRSDVEAFCHSLVLNSFRGKDSTGVAVVSNKNTVTVTKALGNPFNLIETKEFAAQMDESIKTGRFMFGHGRHATVGEKTIGNAHPFEVVRKNDKGEVTAHITLIHNGTLHNAKTTADVAVDSHWMAEQIADNGPDAISNIYGAIATIWYDWVNKKLHIYRNTQRPLYYVEDKTGNIYINSEQAVFYWMRRRLHVQLEKEMVEFKERTLYTVDLKIGDNPKDEYWSTRELKYSTPNRGIPIYEGGRGRSDRDDWELDPESGVWMRKEAIERRRHDTLSDLARSRTGNLYVLNGFIREILRGISDKVTWENGFAYVTMAATNGTPAYKSQRAGQPPQVGLVSLEPYDEQSVLATYLDSQGNEAIAYLRDPDLPMQPALPRNTTSVVEIPVLTQAVPNNVAQFTKAQLKEKAKVMAIPTTPKPNSMARWHSKHKSGKDEGQTINHFGLSEGRDPWSFLAYGNTADGYFHRGQFICAETQYLERSTDSTGVDKYSATLIPEGGSPDIKVVWWSRATYSVGEKVIGKIVQIRSATKQEYEQDETQMVITLANPHTAIGMNIKEVTKVVQAPNDIKDIQEAVKAERRVYAA